MGCRMQLCRSLRRIRKAALKALGRAGLRFFLMLCKLLFKAFFIYGIALFRCHFYGELNGESKGIV